VAGEHLGQHHPQRVDIRTPIDLVNQRRGTAAQRAEVLGGHVSHGSADTGLARVITPGLGEVEIEEQRLSFGADEDVGRLDVAVEDASLMSMVESLAELRPDPGHGALVTQPAEDRPGCRPLLEPGCAAVQCLAGRFAVARGAILILDLHRRGGLDRLQGECQLLAGNGTRRLGPELGQDGRKARPSQIRHANGAQPRARIFVERVNRNDVGVQQLGQRLRLGPFDRCDLEHDGAARQVSLLRQEHPGE
jgi:hypothetical protein